jgi:hypothetical protein
MLPKSYLKVIAASIVYESRLSKTAKTQLMRFIESDASCLQLKAFINTGGIKKESEIEDITELDVEASWAMIVASALNAGKKIQDRFSNEAKRACADKVGAQKKICILKYKQKASKVKIAALQREMSKCNKTSKPKKCREIFEKHIKRLQKDL